MGKRGRVQSKTTTSILPPRQKSLRISRNELVQTSVRVEVDHGHRLFPNEVWEKIFNYLTKKDLQAVTVVSRNIRDIVLKLYWDTPSFRKPMRPQDLESLCQLPIGKLYTSDFVVKKVVERAKMYVEVFEKMESLRDVAVSCGGPLSRLDFNTLQVLAPYVTSLNTGAMDYNYNGTSLQFAEELVRINFPKIKDVVLSTSSFNVFASQELAVLNAKFPITEIHAGVLRYTWDHTSGFNARLLDGWFLLEMSHLKRVGFDIYRYHDKALKAKLWEKGIVFEKQDKMYYVRKYFSRSLYF